MYALISRLRHRGEDGGSAVEYALLASGIAAVLVLVVVSLGGVTRSNLSGACSTLGTKAGSSQTADCSK